MALDEHNMGEFVRQVMTTQMSYEESFNAQQRLADFVQQPDRTSWPTLDLIRCHSKLSRQLREANPFEDSTQGPDTLSTETARQIKQTYSCLANFIPNKPGPALYPTDTSKSISHEYLREFASQFSLPVQLSGDRKPVISVALPNGPLLAAVLVAVIGKYTAAPINPAAGPQQFQADVLQAGATCILTSRDDYAKLELEGGWTQEHGIQVLIVELDEDMRISMTTVSGQTMSAESSSSLVSNTADDIALILFTSGTSGKKKVVPITTHSIVAGVTFVIDSWALTAEDVCLNMMPLYHV